MAEMEPVNSVELNSPVNVNTAANLADEADFDGIDQSILKQEDGLFVMEMPVPRYSIIISGYFVFKGEFLVMFRAYLCHAPSNRNPLCNARR